MSHAATLLAQLVIVIVAATGGLAIPAAIRALPEPEVERLPDDPADDTTLQAQLRSEGSKQPYTAVADAPGLGFACAVVSATLAFVLMHFLGNHYYAWGVAILGPALVLLGVVDWRTRLLPRRIVLPALALASMAVLVEAVLIDEIAPLLCSAAGMAATWSMFWVMWRTRIGGVGFGDVRLAALVGLILGRTGWHQWLVGIYAGLVLFALFAVSAIVASAARGERRGLKTAFPFGPFMIAGAYVGLMVGGHLHLP